ncbi:hypothetical protein Q669_29590 [Labrenzia sp. C1B10]|uniref:hypothetical protein n=1 Tax=unclassified Labrenzia TaxID=2648686 RepID=UPI0003B8FF33|nr:MULTISPECIES: hypothetical protein [unclassified Labrenzia]ERP95724.1 hypothetical protein Q669_29590 [Labrenzia sp. C1B10]ERS05790.1 hypothetical protein Q675_29155 [Labrenzia sp. C1B70]
MSKGVTEEDLKILSTPDAEIIEQTQARWSFDHDGFVVRLKEGGRWQQLMVTHVYLEHVIDELLREAIAFPDEISFSRMPFSQRVSLSRALDLLPSDLVAAIRRVSKMRNEVAHNLIFEIEDDAVKDLENCTPVELRKAIKEDSKIDYDGNKFLELLNGILIYTEILRQRHNAVRILDRKSKIRLRTVLDKTPGANYVK